MLSFPKNDPRPGLPACRPNHRGDVLSQGALSAELLALWNDELGGGSVEYREENGRRMGGGWGAWHEVMSREQR